MAKKHTQIKMTFRFWADNYDVKPNVIEAIKNANGMTNTTRVTDSEFKSIVDSWLNQEVKGDNNG